MYMCIKCVFGYILIYILSIYLYCTGWVKFVRITTAFGTSLLGLGLLVHLVYLLKKTPALKTFSAGVMFIAGNV